MMTTTITATQTGTGIYETLMGAWIEAGRPTGEEWADLWARCSWHLQEQVWRMEANGAPASVLRGIRDRIRYAGEILEAML